ncbi:hypothetical protein L5515_013692 [Caenorhabditis briggsae]|uniref:Uncharacterized protein n=1 Tax=Caenorhabditis briggsae TaxID=6238 RepID=A0AAE9J6R8_CAEBR|nr:hypothetical protein L5515_013692 [Caenorhabditis briggsae]
MFDAVEHCQLNCILDRDATFKKFVHNQKGCYRVYGLKCEDCNAQNSKTQEDKKLPILEKEQETLRIGYQKILEENQQKSLEIEELQNKNLRGNCLLTFFNIKSNVSFARIRLNLVEIRTLDDCAREDFIRSVPSTSSKRINNVQ